MNDLRYLWQTRNTSGFPWPSWRGIAGGWHMAVFGVPPWAALSLPRKVARIPARPFLYARMVRNIARTRATFYHPSMNDDVS